MNRIPLRAAVVTLAFTTALARPAVAADSVMLKPKLMPGQPMYLEVTHDMQQKLSGLPGLPEGKPMTVKVYSIYGAFERPESGTRVTASFDRFLHRMQVPMFPQPLNYDSDDRFKPVSDDEEDDDGGMAEGFRTVFEPMIDMGVAYELSGDCEIKSISGVDAIFKKVEAANRVNPMWMQMKRQITDEGMKSLIGDLRYALYAGKEVKAGDTWTRTLRPKSPFLGDIVLDYRMKLEKTTSRDGRKVAELSFTETTKKAEGSENELNEMGMALESGLATGTAIFDIDLGQIVRVESEHEVRMGSPPPAEAEAKEKPKSGDEPKDDDEPKPAPQRRRIELNIKQTISLIPAADREKKKAEMKRQADEAKAAAAAKKEDKPAEPKSDD
ncbi:MAG: hypothetical protein HUU22_18040 [Phycisphaerae bacterium]|nr:DUF6263 family protein [Phycisphaerae bacterium]NUQ47923.1 hypothetical protein [Phycisphaerae bacterium]